VNSTQSSLLLHVIQRLLQTYSFELQSMSHPEDEISRLALSKTIFCVIIFNV